LKSVNTTERNFSISFAEYCERSTKSAILLLILLAVQMIFC